MKKSIIVLVVVIFGVSFTSAQESIKNFIGNWSYVCDEAPDGYKTGSIIIDQKNSKPSILVVYDDGTKNIAKSIKVQGGVLHFNMTVEDSYIDIELKNVNSKISGKVVNGYDEEIKITATRKK